MSTAASGTSAGSSLQVQPAPPFWRAPLEFAVHTLVGTAIFAIIAAAAVGLDIVVRNLETHGISSGIGFGLNVAEYAIFVTDLILLIVFLCRTAKRAMRKL